MKTALKVLTDGSRVEVQWYLHLKVIAYNWSCMCVNHHNSMRIAPKGVRLCLLVQTGRKRAAKKNTTGPRFAAT